MRRARLPHPRPYDWAALLAFLAARATPGVERVGGDIYARTVTLETHGGPLPGIFTAAPRRDGASLSVTVTAPAAVRSRAFAARAALMFDVDPDPGAISSTLGNDPRLRKLLTARPGVRVPGGWDGFELAVRAILGQQVSVAGATTLAGRLVDAFGATLPASLAAVPPARGLTHLFPLPSVLAGADVGRIGLPAGRAAAIRKLSEQVADGLIRFGGPENREEAIERLGRIRGIGDWTLQYLSMRAFKDADAFPATDLGLRKACRRGGVPAPARELAASAERWRPWRAYAAMALWSSLGDRP